MVSRNVCEAVVITVLAGLLVQGCAGMETETAPQLVTSATGKQPEEADRARRAPMPRAEGGKAEARQGGRSLRESVAAALGHSADIRKARVNLSVAEEETSIAYAGYQPTVQSQAGIGTGDAYDFGLTVGQPLFDWGRTRQDVGRAKAVRSAALSDLAATSEGEALRAAQAHIDVKRSERLADVAEENFAIHKRFTAMAKDRTEGGVGDATEVELAGVHQAAAESALEQARAALSDARRNYTSAAGLQPDSLASVPELPLALPQSRDLDAAVLEAPAVQTANARGQAARNAAKMERASLLPTLSAEAFVRGGDNYDTTKTGVGLRLKGPTMVGLSNFHRMNAAELRAESARWAAESARRDVSLTVHELFDHEPILRKRISILSQQLKKARALRELYEDQFKIGERKLADLVNVQADVFRFEQELVRARADILDLQYSAAAALGILVETLRLAPDGGAR